MFLFKKELEYLGHIVSKDGVKPLPAKLEAIQKMLPPTNVTKLQSFLGLIGYYRRFIPSFAISAQALFNLLKKDVEFKWDKACQSNFEDLKQALCSTPVLRFPNYNQQFILFTDASMYAVGVVLSQLNNDGLDQPVAYFSRTLNKHERNYTVTEKECLAVLFGIKECRAYIYGTHFKVVTDHSSLRWLLNLKDPDGRLARWAIKFQAYDFEIEHRPGSKHINADSLSRLPVVAIIDSKNEHLFNLIAEPSKWGEESEEKQKLLKKWSQDAVKTDSKLYNKINGILVLYIRPSQRMELLKTFHFINTGHAHEKQMLMTMQNYCYWDSMAYDIAKFCRLCMTCAKNKRLSKPSYSLILPNCAFHTISIDVMGPIKRSNTSSGSRFIIAAIDRFTKWVKAEVISSPTAKITARFILSNIIARHGCPQIILSDNGTNFTSKLVTHLNELLGINYDKSPPYRPESNGAIERLNGTLKNILKRIVNQESCYWEGYIPLALMAYRVTCHSVTKRSPFELLYGRKAVLPGTVELQTIGQQLSPEQYMEKLTKSLISIHKEAYYFSALSHTNHHNKYAKKDNQVFNIGEKVLMLRNRLKDSPHKLNSNFIGPFTIIQKFRHCVYSLKDELGKIIHRVHKRFIKKIPYKPLTNNN